MGWIEVEEDEEDGVRVGWMISSESSGSIGETQERMRCRVGKGGMVDSSVDVGWVVRWECGPLRVKDAFPVRAGYEIGLKVLLRGVDIGILIG